MNDLDAANNYVRALHEIRAGRKRTHWVWFVFPQLADLGHIFDAVHVGISGVKEARAYLAHEVLGPRLLECAQGLVGLAESDPVKVMGQWVDALKLRSSMTLFACADPGEHLCVAVLDQYFGGEPDAETIRILDCPMWRQ